MEESADGSEMIAADDTKKERLTPKQQRFLELLAEGKKTIEAYYEAGYKGEIHAAYQLRSRLKEEMLTILEGQGFSKEGLVQELKKLAELPLMQATINVKEKLDILKTLTKLLPQDRKDEKPRITAIVINTGRKEEVKIEPIDVKATESDAKSVETGR
jgi:hypothetical protein